MSFYDLPPQDRQALVNKIEQEILEDLTNKNTTHIQKYFSDSDTYIRKAAYLAIGKLYFSRKDLRNPVIQTLNQLFNNNDEKVRQTVINALGEIGKTDVEQVLEVYEQGLKDQNHTVRNAIIGSLKKMGEKTQNLFSSLQESTFMIQIRK